MTPEQALHVLDQMAARAPGNRADHAAVQEATRVLATFIVEQEREAEVPSPADP